MSNPLSNSMAVGSSEYKPRLQGRRRSNSTTSLRDALRLPPPTQDVLRGPEMFKVIRQKSKERMQADRDRRAAVASGSPPAEAAGSKTSPSKSSGSLGRSVSRLSRSRSITHTKKLLIRPSGLVSDAERAFLNGLAEQAMADAEAEKAAAAKEEADASDAVPNMDALKKREERAKSNEARDELGVHGDEVQAVVHRKRSNSADYASPRIVSAGHDDGRLKEEVQRMTEMAEEEPAKGNILSSLKTKLGFKRSKSKGKSPSGRSPLSRSMRGGSHVTPSSSTSPPLVPKSHSTGGVTSGDFPTPIELMEGDASGRESRQESRLAPSDAGEKKQRRGRSPRRPVKADEDEEQLKAIQEVQSRTQMRKTSIPPSLLKSLAVRAGSLTHRSDEDSIDKFGRFRSMSPQDIARLVIAGVDALQNVAISCLNSSEMADGSEQSVSPALQKLVIRLYHYMSFVVESSCNEEAKAFECGKHIIGILRDTTSAEVVGEANEEMVTAITQERAAIVTSVCNNLKAEAKECLADLVASAVYFSHTYCLYAEQKKADMAEEYSLTLVYAARGVVDAIGEVLDRMAMLDALLVSLKKRAVDQSPGVCRVMSMDTDSINVYDEMLHDHGEGALMCSCHLPEGAATINSIVCNITDPTGNHSLNYVKMIILTLHAFTTPWDLFAKLKERYEAPESIASAYAVGLKVGVVLKQWIGLRFRDIDRELLVEVKTFLEERMSESHKEMAVHLLHALEGEEDACRRGVVQLCEPHTRIEIKGVMENQWDITGLFSDFSAQQIAEQLTLVDRDVFRAVDVKGLIGQAWNKVSQRHVAQSVVNVLHRLNDLAAWVASVILSKKTLSRRIKALTRLVKVCDALRRTRNFMGLAGLIFGMSQVSVNRLKFTFAGLAKSTKKLLIELQELMDPLSSYKEYRLALAAAPPPVIPFIGVKLSDLTMIDEGNPTFIHLDVEGSPPLINVKKQQMVYDGISEILMFQQSCEYDFEPVEPLASYCRHLPLVCSEDELYYLSCSREPPQASAADIK